MRKIVQNSIWVIVCVLLGGPGTLRGSVQDGSQVVRDTLVSKDSLRVGGTEVVPSRKKKKDEKPHSPHRATIMAMILPGSAQIYNGQWWKVPILYGGIGATVYGLSWNTKYYNKYKKAFLGYTNYLTEKEENPDVTYPTDNPWDKLMIAGNSAIDFTSSQQQRFKDQLKNKKNYYKRNRDLLYIVSAGIYIVQIIDATVFAHFYDYEINDDLSMRVEPSTGFSPVCGGTVGLMLTFNF